MRDRRGARGLPRSIPGATITRRAASFCLDPPVTGANRTPFRGGLESHGLLHPLGIPRHGIASDDVAPYSPLDAVLPVQAHPAQGGNRCRSSAKRNLQLYMIDHIDIVAREKRTKEERGNLQKFNIFFLRNQINYLYICVYDFIFFLYSYILLRGLSC